MDFVQPLSSLIFLTSPQCSYFFHSYLVHRRNLNLPLPPYSYRFRKLANFRDHRKFRRLEETRGLSRFRGPRSLSFLSSEISLRVSTKYLYVRRLFNVFSNETRASLQLFNLFEKKQLLSSVIKERMCKRRFNTVPSDSFFTVIIYIVPLSIAYPTKTSFLSPINFVKISGYEI